jgi:hypothetical protein
MHLLHGSVVSNLSGEEQTRELSFCFVHFASSFSLLLYNYRTLTLVLQPINAQHTPSVSQSFKTLVSVLIRLPVDQPPSEC